MSSDDPLFDNGEAAQYLRRPSGFLNQLRCEGKGPVFVKMRGRVFYRRSALEAWLKLCERTSTSPKSAA
jgi:hypothetical protein